MGKKREEWMKGGKPRDGAQNSITGGIMKEGRKASPAGLH